MRLSGADRREQLLDVTAEIAVRRGFSAVTVQSVARTAGVSRPIVYEHFGDLDGLLETLIARESARALDQIKATRLRDLSSGDPSELMLESLEAYLRAVERHPTTWQLVLLPPEGAPEALRASILSGRRAILAGLIEAVAPGIEAGSDASEAELTARMLSAIADEYARLVLTNATRYTPERLLRHARRLLTGTPNVLFDPGAIKGD